MKKMFVFIIFFSFLSSCSNNEDEKSETVQLEGKWKLIEQLADPGDGSGVFVSIDSDKTIEFSDKGSIVSNKSLCDPYSEEEISEGTYSITKNTIITNCENLNIATINFELIDGYLILNFISNEGFSQKFKKLD